METVKISHALTAVENRTTGAEREAGRTALPLNRVARGEILLRRTLAVLTPADRENVLSLASVIRAECPDETARMARQYRTGEDRPVTDPTNQGARHVYFTDHAAYALAAMPHDEAAGIIQEVANST